MGMQRPFRSFLGIDLGGGKGKKTAVARLEVSDQGLLEVVEVGTSRNGQPYYDEALLSYVGEHKDAAVAIDAPLTLTACVRCREDVCPGMNVCEDPTILWFRSTGADLIAADMPDERDRVVVLGTGKNGHRNGRSTGHAHGKSEKPMTTPYTQRAAEVVLHRRHGILPRETLGQGMGPLTARAAHLVRALASHGFAQHRNLIEVYPKATLHKLFGEQVARRYKGKANTWETRARVLENLRGTLEFSTASRMAREDCLANDHCFDAVVCAYTAYLWARDGWQLPEDDRAVHSVDGWIYAPEV
jgi:predicted nuclease with RNAse H fold